MQVASEATDRRADDTTFLWEDWLLGSESDRSSRCLFRADEMETGLGKPGDFSGQSLQVCLRLPQRMQTFCSKRLALTSAGIPARKTALFLKVAFFDSCITKGGAVVVVRLGARQKKEGVAIAGVREASETTRSNSSYNSMELPSSRTEEKY